MKRDTQKKSVLLIGCGRFGTHIARQLDLLGHQVMAVDSNEERVNEILPIVTNAQIGDSTNASFLRSLGVDGFDLCFVTISDDFLGALETTSLLKELGAKFVVSRASRGMEEKFLLRNGADAVVYPERDVAKWSAIQYSADHIWDYIDLDDTHAVMEVTVPDSWVGKKVMELGVRSAYGINILAIKRDGNLDTRFTADTVLSSDERLVVFGTYDSLNEVFHI